ncbi:unnamed protein product [Paramecium sonneborni]|uniref:Uncharacterized protein n=1 Tax=Paramecium sonneborni TaxID=65129 RepID=A0A8S1RPF9_9CILI|nr:unnamed protein product [Paramecium sonneborni]
MKVALDGYNLVYRKIITKQEDQQSQESVVVFGMWSKYNPLNFLSIQKEIGQFESNCYQLVNMVDQAAKSLNFIYYDCLNYPSKQIVKSIMFISEQDQSFQFDKYIDPFEYENIWYHFQLISWPLLKKLELIIMQQDKTILKEIIENISLFNEQYLLFTEAGGFQVMESKLNLIEQGTIFSVFPGQIVSYDVLIDIIPTTFDFEQFIIEEYQNFNQCICQQNEQVKMEDSDLIFLDDKIYVSENINYDYYALSGWIKVKVIIWTSDEFSYQFIKMSANIGKQQLLNDNLSTFQLFYHISSIETKIVIKTYSYDFPIVTKDFSDSSFEIVREFLIEKNIIKSWHYLFCELSEKKLNIKITFNNEQEIQFSEAQVNVKQFNNCQFKLRYGNIMQDTQNYLNVALKQLYYINCKEDDRIKKCHYSCLDCDGPYIQNCLSCSVESQRIFIPQFQHCICPQSMIDDGNTCVDNENSNLQIIENNYVYLNPSRIKDNLITCFECFSNQNWSANPICYNSYYTPLSFYIYYTFIVDFGTYIYDGSDLICCDFCQATSDSKYELQNQQNLYEFFLVKSERFLSFCFNKQDIDEACNRCSLEYCLQCNIGIDKILCSKCISNFEAINGQCILQTQSFSLESCKPPYYASITNQCNLCPIINCIYCFEYVNYLYYNTFEYLDILIYQHMKEQQIRIGCAYCQNGYIFDFTLGLCIKQAPKIEHCLTSYVFQFKEKYLVSTLENFQVSSVINKCENYILNCLLCAIDYKNTIFCIECKDGLIFQEGQCYMQEEIRSNYEIIIQNEKNKAFILIYGEIQQMQGEDLH